jgi:hypothetical protein
MSGQSVNRNLCAKHIPTVVNAIKKLENQVMNSNVKRLIIKNVVFAPKEFWNASTSKWQVSESDESAPANVQYNSNIVWFSDETCNKLRTIMANDSIVSLRLNIPIDKDILNELAARPDYVNHYTAEYTNGMYPYVFQFAGCKWDFINFIYLTASGISVAVTINVKGESQRDQIIAAGGNVDRMNPGIRITDVNRYFPNNAQHATDLDGEQSIYNGGIRMAIPKTPIDIIIEYHE